MSHRTRTVTAGLAAALVIPLAGCIPTLATDDPSTSHPSSGTAAPTPPQHERAGRELTQADAEAALPDLPQGAQERSTEVTASHRKTDPESCLEVLRIGPTYDELAESRVASAKTAWYVQTDGGRQINVGIDSFPDEIGPDLLDRAGAALGECSSFSMTGLGDTGHFDDRLWADGRPAPPLGDQGFAVRVTQLAQQDRKTVRLYSDYLVVRAGHNLVTVTVSHWDESMTFQVLQDHATAVLDELDQQ
ncbi:hypothetical protein AB4Y78_03310 [Janibacter sp. RAF52]|uniref:hypothetical protein n=1 Tax=unclassified Janibacter TaxID=2649294 RepID=UPI003F937F95